MSADARDRIVDTTFRVFIKAMRSAIRLYDGLARLPRRHP